jgi:hypothetical protein
VRYEAAIALMLGIGSSGLLTSQAVVCFVWVSEQTVIPAVHSSGNKLSGKRGPNQDKKKVFAGSTIYIICIFYLIIPSHQ